MQGFKLSIVTVCCQAADDMFLDDFQLLQGMGVGGECTADSEVTAATDTEAGLVRRTVCSRRPTMACLTPREAIITELRDFNQKT